VRVSQKLYRLAMKKAFDEEIFSFTGLIRKLLTEYVDGK